MQKGEEQSFDFVLAQPANRRRGTAAHGGATPLQLWSRNKMAFWGKNYVFALEATQLQAK